MIRTIPPWKMIMVTRGKIVGSLLFAFLLVIIVVSVPMFIEGVQKGQTHQAAMALCSLLIFGALTLEMLLSRKYVPGKTFWLCRNKKLSSQMAIKYSYGVMVLIVVVFVALEPKQAIHPISLGLSGSVGLYFLSKSLKFHADVDFSASEYLATTLGFSVEEKILVSYQNFDAGKVKAGSNAFAATATKLIVASFDGHVWKKLSRDLSQISQIGVIDNGNNSHSVKLQFNDGADVLLSIGLFEKMTSSPVLVVRKLLESIDASLLGDCGAPQVARRSRVVVESDVPISTLNVAAPETTVPSTAPTRNIEFTPEIVTALQNAEEVIPGRRLEL